MGRLGIIGGSGLYDLPGFTGSGAVPGRQPFGEPSAPLVCGLLAGQELAFLPRHGPGHRLPPSAINYRANIDSLKRAGVTDVLSVGACGSLREDVPPGTFVIVDQFIDRTARRENSFFGEGCVAHVSMADPVCSRLGDHVEAVLKALSIPCLRGGTYLVMEGPQFSTRAESRLYRQWGADVIGMTNMHEARLAREAEICFATEAMVTDFDCWDENRAAVDVGSVLGIMNRNVAQARVMIAALAERLGGQRPDSCPHGCDRALDMALVTAPEQRHDDMRGRLDAVAGRVLGISCEP